jgi:hypothetical protein
MATGIGAALPEWRVAQWFNTPQPLRLADLRGQVVLMHAFQMLCEPHRVSRRPVGLSQNRLI